VSPDTKTSTLAGVSRPPWNPDTEQQQLLDAATQAAQVAHRAEQAMWDAAIAARRVGVPDDRICDATDISRSTLNRRYGARRDWLRKQPSPGGAIRGRAVEEATPTLRAGRWGYPRGRGHPAVQLDEPDGSASKPQAR